MADNLVRSRYRLRRSIFEALSLGPAHQLHPRGKDFPRSSGLITTRLESVRSTEYGILSTLYLHRTTAATSVDLTRRPPCPNRHPPFYSSFVAEAFWARMGSPSVLPDQRKDRPGRNPLRTSPLPPRGQHWRPDLLETWWRRRREFSEANKHLRARSGPVGTLPVSASVSQCQPATFTGFTPV